MAGPDGVVIVGGGQAGAQAAATLRQKKFEGAITLVSDENELPYERPPLSKDYLSGERPFERMLLRSAAYWEERAVTLTLGRSVVAVDSEGHSVALDGGERLAYRSLIWAAGGKPRRIPCDGGDLEGVHGIRTRADVDRLLLELGRAEHIVVIGGGYIGLEAAAVLSKLGKKVVVLEAMNRVLARVTGEVLSRFYEAEHRAHGVDLRLEARVACIEAKDGRACAVLLADGTRLPADVVIVGIGIEPSIGPLVRAGASAGDGIEVDASCRTTLSDVLAIGDCAWHPNPFANGDRIRLESVQNANDQAVVVAEVLTGKAATYDIVPWFWSNQYDLRLQTVGLSRGHDHVVLRGDPSRRAFTVAYLRQGTLIALDCINTTSDFVQGKALITARCVPPLDVLADPTVPLKTLKAPTAP